MPLSTIDPVPALIVVDLQAAVLSRPAVHPFEDIVARSAELAAAFRARAFPVVLVNVDSGAPGRSDAATTPPGMVFPAEALVLVPELDATDGDILITKHTWGAFNGTDLDERLRAIGVTQVFVTGVATTAGVESTARFAHELGYNVVLVTDAMTDRDLGAHEHTVSWVFPRIGETTTTAEVLAALPAAQSA
jgi:nicotinamidase-related amidase